MEQIFITTNFILYNFVLYFEHKNLYTGSLSIYAYFRFLTVIISAPVFTYSKDLKTVQAKYQSSTFCSSILSCWVIYEAGLTPTTFP